MSPLTILLSLMIPMLAGAIPTLDEATPHTLFPFHHRGDVLNVTQCYCHSLAPLSPNATFGYYVRIQCLRSSFIDLTSRGMYRSSGYLTDCRT